MSHTLKIDLAEAYACLFEPARYKAFYGGRGAAKSTEFTDALLVQGIQHKHRILCCREIQKSIRDSVHKLIADRIDHYGLGDVYEVQNDRIIGKNGTEFIFKGLRHNVTEIKSTQGLTRVWVEEAENVSDRSWELLIPTVREPNSEIWLSFNTRSLNDPTYQRFVVKKDYNSIVKKVSWRDNPWFPDVLRAEKDKLKSEDYEAYLHVWEGEPDTRRSGCIYAKQLAKAREEGRITTVPYDPVSEVFTAWDLGWGDATAIWFLQFVGRELRWIDFYENSQEETPHYVDVVKSKPYNYKIHYIPHDGAHGNVRGPSVTKQLSGMGLRNKVLDREVSVSPGIDLLRQTIGYSVFDAKRCADGIHALENNHFRYDEDRARFSDNPYHDWSEHASSAARYAAIAASMEKKAIGVRYIKPVAKEGYRMAAGGDGWMG